jgi:3-methyladenine DNA glycosylase Tag
MEAPRQVKPTRLADYLEVMSKAVFQAGISWAVIDAKWEGFREAFEGFDPETVAGFDPPDVDRLAQDTRIVRNRRKIEATVQNAETIVTLDRDHDGFGAYLRSHGGFEQTVADLKKRFKFLGETGCYYFLYVVGEEVPAHDEWSKARGLDPATGRPPRKR